MAHACLEQDAIERKMEEYEPPLNNLQFQQSLLELERGYKITKQDLLCFVEELLKGDKNDKDFQRQIIDNLVYKIYVSDDDNTVYLNIKGGQNIETVEYSEHSEKLHYILF